MLWDKYTEVELLSYMVFYIPTNSTQGLQFFHILTNISHFVFVFKYLFLEPYYSLFTFYISGCFLIFLMLSQQKR